MAYLYFKTRGYDVKRSKRAHIEGEQTQRSETVEARQARLLQMNDGQHERLVVETALGRAARLQR